MVKCPDCEQSFISVPALSAHRKIHRPNYKKKPRIIVVCGSSRFVARIAVMKWEIEKQGDIAMGMHLLPAWYGADADHQAEKEGVATVLDELHLRKIDLADEVLIANVDGYIGERTRVEIEYAQRKGKPVRYLEAI